MNEALEIVLEAADRQSREYLAQASKYEALEMPTIAQETMDKFYHPLRTAIETVRKGSS